MDGIRLRLIVMVLLAALPGFIFTLLAIPRLRHLADAEAEQEALQLLQEAVQKQDGLTNEVESLLLRLSKQPQVMGSHPATCNAFMADIHRQYPHFSTIGVARSDGRVVCSAVPLPAPMQVKDRTWFQKAMQTQSFAIGQYRVGAITNTPILSFGYPIVSSTNQVKSVLFASLKLSYINELVAVQQLPANTTLSVVDRQGTILVHHPEPAQWVGKSIHDTPLFQELKLSRGKTVTITASELDGISRKFALTRLLPQELPDLTIAVGIPETYIQAQVKRELLMDVLLVALTTGLAVAMAGWFSQRFIQRPIERLRSTAQQWTEGNLPARIQQPYGPGELGQLAVAFNEMAAGLERYVNEQATVQRERERAELEMRFAAIASHELRSPLSTLKMSVELLQTFDQEASEEQKQYYFQQLNGAIDRMTQLLEDVLLIRRAESENFELRAVRIDLDDFCYELIGSLQAGTEPERSIRFSSQGVAADVYLDKALLRSVLTNLLSNAIKYSPPPTAVHFNLSYKAPFVIFEIRDEGIGIPAADQARLFEIFYRAGNVDDTPGSGLGLAIVKRLVELLEGEISFASVEGEGTLFRVTLPLGAAPI